MMLVCMPASHNSRGRHPRTLSVVIFAAAAASPRCLGLPLLVHALGDVALLGEAFPRRVGVGRLLGKLLVAILGEGRDGGGGGGARVELYRLWVRLRLRGPGRGLG